MINFAAGRKEAPTHQGWSSVSCTGCMRPSLMAGARKASPSVTASANAAEFFFLQIQNGVDRL